MKVCSLSQLKVESVVCVVIIPSRVQLKKLLMNLLDCAIQVHSRSSRKDLNLPFWNYNRIALKRSSNKSCGLLIKLVSYPKKVRMPLTMLYMPYNKSKI
jgi:hypothetical protein